MKKVDMLAKIFEQLHNNLPLLSIEYSPNEEAIFYNYTHLYKFPLLKSKDIVSLKIGTQQLINRLMIVLFIKAQNHQLENYEEKFICRYKRFIATSRLAEFLPYFSPQSQAEIWTFLLLRKLA